MIYTFIRKSIFILLPFWLLILLYFILDPFQVIYHYDIFYGTGKSKAVLDRDYVSTVMFDRQYEMFDYNSFILGNSRSITYEIAVWDSCLSEKGNSYYHFDASAESLYALTKKVEYIDKKGCDIKNMLLVIDDSLLKQDKASTGHLFYPAPQLTGESIIPFHMAFFKAFCSPKFIYALLDYKISGEIKDYMRTGNLLSDAQFSYNAKTNEITYPEREEQIAIGKFYDKKRMKVFEGKASPDKIEEPVILKPQFEMLKRVKEIFVKHQTNYKIVISPLFYQVKLNPIDLQVLQKVFGEVNVFDYSGTNDITINYRNYYEDSHYRPCVAKSIMEDIYK